MLWQKTVFRIQCRSTFFVKVAEQLFITTKTVVGDAITIGDTIILPLVDVSFGVGAGAFAEGNKNNGAGGMGGKISPSAVLVINKNGTKLVNVKNQM